MNFLCVENSAIFLGGLIKVNAVVVEIVLENSLR